MNEDRRKILDLLVEGRIDADGAERLLDKLSEGKPPTPSPPSPPSPPGAPERHELPTRAVPRYLRFQATAEEGNMDARIPLALIKTGIKLEAMLPDGANDELKNHGVDLGQLSGMAADEMVEALAELEVDIEGLKGERVRVFCE